MATNLHNTREWGERRLTALPLSGVVPHSWSAGFVSLSAGCACACVCVYSCVGVVSPTAPLESRRVDTTGVESV